MVFQKQMLSVAALGILLASSSAYAGEMAATGHEGRVEWSRTQEIAAPAGTIDFTYSLDGKYAFFLTDDSQVKIYTKDGLLEGSVSVDAGVHRIDIAPQGELLYLHNDNDNSLTTVKIDFVVKLDIAGAPVKGNVNAPVTITVFTDFECPYCKKLVQLLDTVYDANKDNVKIAFKNMPLDFHKSAEPAARGGIAAAKQGKFWEYHDDVFAIKRLKNSSIEDVAEDIGLDMKKFKEDMNSEATRAHVQKDIADAQKAGVTGTPTVFINGRKLKQRNQQGFQTMIDQALSQAGHK